MEFGKLGDVESVNWTLPANDPVSMEFLRRLPAALAPTRFLIGTPAWGHKEWIGKIYPPKTKATEFLHHYSRNFNTIELNTTHYRIPSQEQTEKWLSQVSEEFVFCPKLFQGISHSDAGLLDRSLLAEWLQFLKNLKTHRGPCFAQFPPHFDYQRKNLLFHFLQQWPKEFELALEFRHPSWFHEGQILPALAAYLRHRNIGLVITDVAGRRDVLHTTLSADFTALRFVGNNLHVSDAVRARAWAQRLSEWSRHGLRKVVFFVHEPDDIFAPEMANTVIYELNEEAGADLAPLQWVI